MAQSSLMFKPQLLCLCCVRTAQKTSFLCCCSLVYVRNLLPSRGRCLQSHYLATGLLAIILHLNKCVSPFALTLHRPDHFRAEICIVILEKKLQRGMHRHSHVDRIPSAYSNDPGYFKCFHCFPQTLYENNWRVLERGMNTL